MENPLNPVRARVAVLMPTYNRRSTLGAAMASVVRQEFTDWALLVVNDGGQDVADLVAAANDARIHYVNADHQGKSAALNLGIALSDSDYIAYLDDDDGYYPNHLRELVSALDAHPDWEMVCSRTVAESWVRETPAVPYRCVGRKVLCDGRYTAEMMRFHNQIPNLNVVHRRALFEAAGLYDPALPILIDWDMYRRFSYVADCHLVPVVTGVYRRFEGQGHIGALGREKPRAMTGIMGYIRARIPGLTTVIRLRTDTAATGASAGGRLSVAVCKAPQGSEPQALAQALAAEAAAGAEIEWLVPEGVLNTPPAGVATRLLPVTSAAGAGAVLQAALAAATGDRLVMLRSDMLPAPGFVRGHLSGEGSAPYVLGRTLVSRTGWTGPAADLADPLAVPALVAMASLDPARRELHSVWNEWAAYNLSLPVAAARQRLDGFSEWESPVWFQPFFERLAPALEAAGLYRADVSAVCRLADPAWELSAQFARWGRALAAVWGQGPRLDQARAMGRRYGAQAVFLKNVERMLARLRQAQAAGQTTAAFAAQTGIPAADLPEIMSELVRSACERALLAGLEGAG